MEIFKSNMTLIGLIIMTPLVMFYSYYSNKPIDSADLITVNGRLTKKPQLITQGGDMPDYEIELNLKNIDKGFSLTNCGYDLIDSDRILALPVEQLVKLSVDKNDLKSKENVLIYSFIIENETVFNIDNYNTCYTNYWKRLNPIFAILLITFIVRLIYLVRMKRYNNEVE